MPYPLDSYLHLTQADARAQFERILARRPASPGSRQEAFLPVEMLLCFGASFRVNGHGYGGANITRAPAPVPQLARLFRRSPGSIIRKMSNLDGSSPNGAKNDMIVALELTRDVPAYLAIYQRLLLAARAADISADQLPDYLELVPHNSPADIGEFFEIDLIPDWQMEQAVQIEIDAWQQKAPDIPTAGTERLAVAGQRIGQQRFAKDVLRNYQRTCAFCGLRADAIPNSRHLLIASHVKPWRDATGRERLDAHNGIAACPTHDVAFDQGLVTVADDLAIVRAPHLRDAVAADERVAHNFGATGMLDRLLVPSPAASPGDAYLRWHREHVWGGADMNIL
jgi:putative restriction endonuclease